MKRLTTFVLAWACMLGMAGCGSSTPTRTQTMESDLTTYYEMSDGTWECDGRAYQHRLEISGTMPNASVGSTFVYLSNLESISFEQAYMASGISSNLDDYFAAEDAVLVEWSVE